jgi:SAM-dependent methyltransferase
VKRRRGRRGFRRRDHCDAGSRRGRLRRARPAYDALTADYDHDAWLSAIERVAVAHGPAGRRVLDVACGTGKSFLPLLERGYDVTACGTSAAMLAVARAKVGTRASLQRLDMRALPALGRFDLVTCLDDALNYLPDEAAVTEALTGMRANLARCGVLVFDVNALRTYRGSFAGDWVVDGKDCVVAWRGRTPPDLSPGGSAELVVDAFLRPAGGGEAWVRHRAVHRQFHHRPLDSSGPSPRPACACARGSASCPVQCSTTASPSSSTPRRSTSPPIGKGVPHDRSPVMGIVLSTHLY